MDVGKIRMMIYDMLRIWWLYSISKSVLSPVEPILQMSPTLFHTT